MILSFSHYTEKNGPSGRSNLGNESDSYFRVTERDCLREFSYFRPHYTQKRVGLGGGGGMVLTEGKETGAVHNTSFRTRKIGKILSLSHYIEHFVSR